MRLHQNRYFQRMVKSYEIMKEAEIEAIEAVSALLSKIPILENTSVEHEAGNGHDKGFDAVINLENAGRKTAIFIEVKNKGQPRYVRSAIYQLRNYTAHMSHSVINSNVQQIVPMLVTPYLSPEARALCDEYNVCYPDLYGNARLNRPGFTGE